MTYTAPLADMRFALREIAGLDKVAALPGYEHATEDTVDAVLEEAAKLAGNGLAPLNRDGDKVGAKLENGVVRTAPGFTGIYKEFVDGGWNSLPFDPEFGGQGMPWLRRRRFHQNGRYPTCAGKIRCQIFHETEASWLQSRIRGEISQR